MLGVGLPGCPALPHPWPCGETTSAQSPSRQSHPTSAAHPRKSEERGSGVLLQTQCSCQLCTKAPRHLPGGEARNLLSLPARPAPQNPPASLRSLSVPRRPPEVTLLAQAAPLLSPHTQLVLPGRLLGVPAEGAANRGGSSQSRPEQRHPGWRRGREACQLLLRNHWSTLMAQCPGQAGPQQPQGGGYTPPGKGP